VIVCHNQARSLREAVESVLGQTVSDLETIVIDDGSTDESPAVARDYPQVRYLREESRGLAAARNVGIRESSGRYLVFLDADDRLLPHALDAAIEEFRKHPTSGFVFGASRTVLEDGTLTPTEVPASPGQDAYWNLLEQDVVGIHSAVVYRRNLIEAAGGFDETLAACEDYELYLRIARRWPIHRHATLVV